MTFHVHCRLALGQKMMFKYYYCTPPVPIFLAQMVKNPPATQDTQVRFLSQEDPLEMGMATHSSILAWRIPWTSNHYLLPCQRNLSGYCPWSHKESDMTEQPSKQAHAPVPTFLGLLEGQDSTVWSEWRGLSPRWASSSCPPSHTWSVTWNKGEQSVQVWRRKRTYVKDAALQPHQDRRESAPLT